MAQPILKTLLMTVSLLLVVVATVSAKTVDLSWDPSPDGSVVGYKVYYQADSSTPPLNGDGAVEGASPIDVGNNLSTTLSGLGDGSTHYFAVTAYNSAGEESDYSNIVESEAINIAQNQPPILSTIGSKSVVEGDSLRIALAANDPDGDSLTYAATGLPGGANLNSASGAFDWTPAYDQAGNYSVTFIVSDGSLSDSETVEISVGNVNRPPVLGAIGSKTVAENNNLSFSLDATDPDSDNLSYSASSLPSGATFNTSNKTFSWSPDSSQAGNYIVTFVVSDGELSDSEMVAINVTDNNQAPVLSTIGSKTVSEGSSLSFSVSADDPDGDNLDYTVSSLPAGADFDPATQTFVWTPDLIQAGNYVVTFVVSDGELSDSEMVAINVINVNQAPVLEAIGSKSIAENSSLNFSISGSDADGDSLSYRASNLPVGASFNFTSRTFSWTPDNSQAGNYVITFTVSDGDLSDSEMVTVSVSNVNQAPVLDAIGSKTVNESDSLTITVSANDPDGDSLNYTATGLPTGATFNPSTRIFNWTPETSQAGNYVVTFAVSDGNLSDSEMVAINVGNTNQAPVLSPVGNRTVNEADSLTLSLSATDPDGDDLSYAVSGLPDGASFDAISAVLSWTPDYEQAGDYQLNFSVRDGSLQDVETVTITVVNVNRAPVVGDLGARSVVAGSLLDFTVNASDADGDNLTYSSSGLPSGASFSPSTKTFSWTPTGTQVGSYAVSFTVADAESSAVATVAITVEPDLPLDSDGDGVVDAEDAFPQDASEWVDTDMDGIGNNADLDDDGDGVNDVVDSAPLDDTISAWTITAMAGEGGSISPAGTSLVAYDAAQSYTISAATGFYLADVLIDGISIGPVEEYLFVSVAEDHSIEALFLPAEDGLRLVADDQGLPGVDRIDGGNDSDNLVDGQPKGDLDYVFRVAFQDRSATELPNVVLVLNGYAYRMEQVSGNASSGATYAFVTRLGPADSHSFHFETRDAAGAVLSRYPEGTELAGPQVEFLNGKNMVGVTGAIDLAQLYSDEALGTQQAYRWIPSTKKNGSFERVNNSGPVRAGEGYVIRSTDPKLPPMARYSDLDAEIYQVPVRIGWNLIANPYGGNVLLRDIQVQVDGAAPLSWSAAVENLLVVDGVYYYSGKDWGNSNIYQSGDGEQEVSLVPHVGYWFYVNTASESAVLLIPKPQQ